MLRLMCFFFKGYGDHRDLHVQTHAFPTRRFSDLLRGVHVDVGGAEPLARDLEGEERAGRIFEKGVDDGQSGERIENSTRTLLSFEIARSEEHTSELQSLMRISYAVFCLNKKNT